MVVVLVVDLKKHELHELYESFYFTLKFQTVCVTEVKEQPQFKTCSFKVIKNLTTMWII